MLAQVRAEANAPPPATMPAAPPRPRPDGVWMAMLRSLERLHASAPDERLHIPHQHVLVCLPRHGRDHREAHHVRHEARRDEEGPGQVMRVEIKYTKALQPVLSGLQRVSKPGRRIYTRREAIPRVKGGLGFAILSTSKGVMTGEDAWRAGVGGEVICYVW